MNASKDMVAKLTNAIAARARLTPEQVDPDAHFILDMGMSSLDLFAVLAFTERAFSTRFPDNALADLTTLNKVVDAVSAYSIDQTGTET